MNRIFVLSCLLLVLAKTDGNAQGFPNVPQTPGQLLTPLLEPMQGRTAVIEWHNGWLYTAPESPDSLPGSDIQARRWDLSNLTNVHAVELLGVSPQPVNAHGSLKVGDRLVLGGDGYDGRDWSFRAVAPGVNERGPIAGLNGIGVRGTLYYPWFVDQTYWSYNAISGNASLWLRGQQLSSWDHLALTGVIGHPFIIGNLLIFASDQSRTGVATYDISNPASPVLLDVLKAGGPGGYWPEIWGGDGKLYVVFPYRENGHGMRVVEVTDPTNLRFLADVPLPGAEPMYIQFQDEYAFLGSHKVDMRTFQSVQTFIAPNIDTSQYLLPLGNLLVTGGAAPNQGLAVWAHQADPDLRGPSVGYHIPRAGQTNYPIGAPISLLIHETVESHTITVGTNFIVRPLGGTAISGIVAFAFDDTLTFTPDQPLQPDTTYEVVIPAGGIQDAAGNGIEEYAFTFSTGGEVQGNHAPEVTAFTGSPYVASPGQTVTFNATATDPDGDSVTMRFDFGDGSMRTDWSSATSMNHSYTNAGHYQAKVQVRDPSGIITTRPFTVTIVAPLPVGARPSSSSQVIVHDASRTIWTVNPDNNTIRSLNADTLIASPEITVNADPRALTVDAAGTVWVTCQDADRLDLVSGGAVVESIELPYGSAPFGIVMSPDGFTAYVSLHGRGEVARFNTASRAQTGVVSLGPTPRALVLNSAGDRLYVTRFLSANSHATVWEVDTGSMTLSREFVSRKFGGILHADGTADGKGIANHLVGVALSPNGSQLMVAANKMNTDRGLLNDNDLDTDNTVRNVVLIFDVTTGQRTDALDIDNSDSASAIAFSPLGDYFFVTLQGNNEIAIFDTLAVNSGAGLGGFVSRRAVGSAPQSVAVDAASGRVLVNNFMSRTISALDLNPLFQSGALTIPATTISTVDIETLSAPVLRGKQLFYHASDPRMSAEGYISCATCHLDGGHDGRTWDFTGRGEGLRNTATLRGRSGTGHGNVHWSANFDEIQDFEHDIRNAFGGAGFLSNEQFATANTPLGVPKAGLNSDLDALAAYASSLGEATIPRSPHRETNGALSANAATGATIFASLQCNACHAGPAMTDTLLHDVGTLRASSGQRLGLPLAGIETPTLRGVWETAPYFHDGSATTLEDVFVVAAGRAYQAEGGTRNGNATLELDVNFNVLINYDRTVRNRGLVGLQAPAGLVFANVDGGSGGVGAIEVRYSSSNPYPLLVIVNGVQHTLNIQPTGNDPTWRMIGWSTGRIEGIALNAGQTNIVELRVEQLGPNIGIDEIVVSNSDDLARAYPHRQVLSLQENDRIALLDYLRQLDGSAVNNGIVPPPAASVSLPEDAQTTGASSRSTLSFGVEFTRVVSGFGLEDLLVAGTAQAQSVQLVELNPGRIYRVNISGMLQAGTVVLQVVAGAATDLAGRPTVASDYANLNWQPFVDDLAPLSDEFDAAASQSEWSLLQTVEGWNINKLEQWDVNSSAAGHMRLMPHTTAWYMNLRGPLVFKEVTGDFIATVRIDLRRRNGQPGRPEAAYSFGGLMIRAPQNTVAAAPNPPAAPGTRLNWPPDNYSSDWTPNQENHIGISLGSPFTWQNQDPNQWTVEARSTVNSFTDNAWSPLGVPAGVSDVTFQVVRIGSTFLLLRRHGDGEWIVEQRYERPDMPDTLQVGFHCVTDYQGILDNNLFAGQNGWAEAYHHNRNVISAANGFSTNPDLVMDVDYFRLQRPHEQLTATMLQEIPFTRANGIVQFLYGTTLVQYIGAQPDQSQQTHLPGGAMTFEHYSTTHGISINPSADADGDGYSNLVEWAFGGTNPLDGNTRPSCVHSTEEMEGTSWFVVSHLRLIGGETTEAGYTIGNLTYEVTVSGTLNAWNIPAEPCASPLALPPAPVGYEWSSHRVAAEFGSAAFFRIRLVQF